MTALAETIRRSALPLRDDELTTSASEALDPLLTQMGDARFVLLGEATHGTHEFYAWRAAITKRLIVEKGFEAIAIEADWPDAYRVNRYVRNVGFAATERSPDADGAAALAGFERFPQWMWRNADVLDFVEWLRAHNDGRRSAEKIGVYGLDLYSLHASIEAVLRFLEKADPEAAARARERYACFGHYSQEPRDYGYATGVGITTSCEREAIAQLLELRERATRWAKADGMLEEAIFEVEQNARVVRDAEAYYRHMFHGRVSTWNLRDRHMVDTLVDLAAHLDRVGSQRVGRATPSRPSKVIVWAHNSHLGDARATYMASLGEHNIGQLVRERFGRQAFLLGFMTFEGTVTAASDWEGPAERMTVTPAMAGSFEALFHETGLARFVLPIHPIHDARSSSSSEELEAILRTPRLERAIGVVYRPKTERASHYFEARIGDQFDAILHLDRTSAVEPLERVAREPSREPPETYPFAV